MHEEHVYSIVNMYHIYCFFLVHRPIFSISNFFYVRSWLELLLLIKDMFTIFEMFACSTYSGAWISKRGSYLFAMRKKKETSVNKSDFGCILIKELLLILFSFLHLVRTYNIWGHIDRRINVFFSWQNYWITRK
jgi:hypothetical protein